MSEQIDSALNDAIDSINYLNSLNILSRGPVWTRLWYSLEFEWNGDAPRFVTMPSSADEKLVSEARQSRDAFEFARWIASSRIRAGVHIPPYLRELIAEWMDASWTPPPKKRGPPAATNWTRDLSIRFVLDLLFDQYGIPATKNRAHSEDPDAPSQKLNRKSGAEIVQHALRRAGLRPPNFARIENIATNKAFIEDYEEIRGLLLAAEFENLEPEERI